MRNIKKRLLACVLAVTMCVCTINVPVQAEVSNDLEQISTDIVESEEVVESEEGSLVAESGEVVESEEGSSVAESEEVVESEEGSLVAESEEVVESEEGSSVAESEEVIESEEGNSVAESEEVVESETETTIVEEMTSWDGNTTESVFEENDYRIIFTLSSYWSGGYNASIKIENNSEETIHNWYLELDYNNTISNIWNAEIQTNEEKCLVIKNAGWNQDIFAGGSVEFGFSGNSDFKGFPTEYKIISDKKEMNTGDYSFEYHLYSDWGSGFSSAITIANNTEVALEDWIVTFDFDRNITDIWNGVIESHENNHYVIRNAGYNSNIVAGQSISFGFNGNEGTADLVPSNYKIYSYSDFDNTKDEYDMSDSDGDGLPNFYEDLIHADKYNTDSDGDGLPDGYEIFTLQLNPTKADSDGNGIQDGDEDADEDGLSNLQEYQLVIDPRDADTDGDHLPDILELQYGMNPNDQDTLDDGIIDGDRSFDVVVEGESSDNSLITPHLAVELCGNQIESLNIKKLNDEDQFLNSSVPGYLGNGYDLTVDGIFDEATLSFELSDEIWNNSDIEPSIYYWNEETQILEELENQYKDGNKICTKLEHFSKYILLAKNKYQQDAFCFTIEAPTEDEQLQQAFDVSFVLDESGSISSSDYSLMKKECMGLIEKLEDTDRIAIFTFDHRVRKRISFSDKDTAINILKYLSHNNGSTAIYDAINVATQEYVIASNESAAKIMILLTDGYDNYSANNLSTVTQKAKDNNIVIYTIGVGGASNGALTSIASATGGAYFNINSFAQLETVFNRIIEEADLYKDSDSDGLSDYHEKKIAAGELQIGSGEAVKCASNLSYLNPDSDGDGLLDGEEVEVRKFESSENYYCFLYSNPCMVDSDEDGYEDYAEDYIGTSPLSTKNEIVTSYARTIRTNTWPEWVEMMSKHSWNYIHNLTQTDIKIRDTSITSELILPIGRADLFREMSFEIWEVKPASYAREPQKSKGIEQLKRYVACNPKYKIGGSSIGGNTFETPGGEYTVTYENMNNGLIVYTFEKNKQPDGEKVPVTEKEKEKDIYYVYQPQLAPVDHSFWNDLLAIAIIGGTLAEDIFTGGAGIADDAASFSFAFYLMGL